MVKSDIQKAQDLLDKVGVKINGNKPWDIQIKDNSVYSRVFSQGSIGLGESYMDGLWDCKSLDQFFYKILSGEIDKKVKSSSLFLHVIKSKLINQQRKSKAFNIGEEHYDLGNDLYKSMLDKRLTYTCGYWKNVKNLDDSQEAKLDLVCKKLNLKKGQKILDIGCGWGSFMKYATEKYDVSCIGITVSKEQVKLGKELCKGLPIEFKLVDYRDLNNLEFREKFDHVVSLGMFEHVGYKNYGIYMQTVNHVLKEGGLFLLHTIGTNKSLTKCDPWFNKYIFPHGMLPSIKQIGESVEPYFVMEDWHNFGTDYDKTLMSWFENFNKNWPKLKATKKYDERFYRMWKYYLLSVAGAFRSRRNQLWQIVLSKNPNKGYESVR